MQSSCEGPDALRVLTQTEHQSGGCVDRLSRSRSSGEYGGDGGGEDARHAVGYAECLGRCVHGDTLSLKR